MVVMKRTHRPAAELLQASRRQLVETWERLETPTSGRAAPEVWTEPVDIAQEAVERDTAVALSRLLAQLREDVEHALVRLDEGDYGTCEDCLRAIPAERLRARPEAVRCVACQRSHDFHRMAAAS